MRSIWKGVISFGLVSIPVRLYSATQERDVSFHQVRRSDGSRVRYRRVSASDGEEVPYGEIAKGYELPDGEMVVLTDEDFANLPLSTSRAIDVLEFVPLDQVDPIYFAKSYYLEPDRTGTKRYVLLRDALQRSGRVALVKIALRQREQLATLRVRNNVFVLETMLWPDEVREPDFPFLDKEVDVREQELAMATSLIDTLAADFDPTKFSDTYREALEAVIDAKVAGREVVVPPSEEVPAPAGDLMAALRASIEAARTGRTARAGKVSPDGERAAGEAGSGGRAADERKRPAARSRGGRTRSAATTRKRDAEATGDTDQDLEKKDLDKDLEAAGAKAKPRSSRSGSSRSGESGGSRSTTRRSA